MRSTFLTRRVWLAADIDGPLCPVTRTEPLRVEVNILSWGALRTGYFTIPQLIEAKAALRSKFKAVYLPLHPTDRLTGMDDGLHSEIPSWAVRPLYDLIEAFLLGRTSADAVGPSWPVAVHKANGKTESAYRPAPTV